MALGNATESNSVSIYICTHKDAFFPKSNVLKPLLLGANKNSVNSDMLRDNSNDNISDKNPLYCELTGHYWVWKNDLQSDYIGFFHYRRYFNFSNHDIAEDGWGNIVYDSLNQRVLDELGINDNTIVETVIKYDCIIPRLRTLPEKGETVYTQYVNAKDHHEADFDCAISILLEKYPEYQETVGSFLKSNKSYDCNMFILKRNLFVEWSEFVFSILFEVENQRDFSTYNKSELRVLGYLAERLTSIWFMHNIKKQNLKSLELQKTFFKNTDKFIAPHPSENAVVLVFSSSNDYVPYLACLIKSIISNAKSNRSYEIYVLTTSITQDNSIKLQRLTETDTRFKFNCINISSFATDKLFCNAHIPIETYYRFYILDLFKECKKVLYLDSDIIVNSDVANLYDVNLGDNYFAATIDVDIAGQMKLYPETSSYIKREVGIKENCHYFQAGVLLFNIQEILKIHNTESLIKIAKERQWRYMDQDILNHEFHKKIAYIEAKWNMLINCPAVPHSRMEIISNAPAVLYDSYLEARANPKIIHYAGWKKPWNYENCDFAVYFWKYARETEFYEEILRRFCEAAAPNYGEELERRLAAKDSEIAELHERLQSIERNMTSRRFLFKWAFSKSLWYRALRKIWRMVRRK